ncbi:RDD family protein [Oerskovia merdavium]|uniref:RDD family protein n=1 Tax=Oerskovia merdavium TaxID=2762227 RepID=A0ABR8U1U6_9CELL|nr:RDD family protein [Oerskovia merdavium]MBD7981735.1 RDD family protein [Oerskovia merdavium]
MSETTTCSACGTTQAAGSAFCAVCGTRFPRTGSPYGAGPAQAPGPDPVSEPALGVTTEREVAAMTQRAHGFPVGPSQPGVPGLSSGAGAPGALGVPGSLGLPAMSSSAGGRTAPVAGVGRRFVAFLVDCAVIGLVAGGVVLGGLAALGVPLTGGMTVATQAQAEELLGSVTILWAVTGALGLVYWLGIWFWEGRTGRTIGNLLLGLRTVRAEDRSPLGFGRAALRWIVIGLGAIACGVGEFLVALSPAFDKSGRGQGWHDKAAKAVVLDVRGAVLSAPTGPHAPAEQFAAMPPTGAFATPAAGYAAPAATPGQYSPTPPAGYVAPVAPGYPGAQRAPVAPDPWAFGAAPAPQAGVQGGLITGVPGAPGGPAAQVAPSAPADAPSSGGGLPGPTAQPPVSYAAPSAPPQQAPAAPAAPVASAAAADEDPDWDSTRFSVSDVRRDTPDGFVLELESGRRVTVTGSALIGRNPQATGEGSVVLVAVEDPTRSVSKTHAEMGVDADGLWLVDRGSTNGTILTRPGGAPQVLEAGVRAVVTVGSVVQVGDRRLTVHPGGAA